MSHFDLYKCEGCGGTLIMEPDRLSGVCPYCSQKRYFASEKTSALLMMLSNAQEHLNRNDFDNAIDLYTAIRKEYPTDAEAAWGLALSTYGIVYTRDDKTGAMIPTCSRIIKNSILDFDAYRDAIRYCHPEQKKIYKSKAEAIDRLQKEIKLEMEREEDFDVFISFKSKDKDGVPTEDSVIARRIYDELTARGIKTFFSEVTLLGKIGEKYEPTIYRALFSCKFFILVTTKEEYTNAPWVKNEWTRFRDRATEENLSGAWTAVYKNVSPYTLPNMFRTQGIDLEKHPFDYTILLADNLENKLGTRKTATAHKTGGNVDSLIKRIFIFLEDGIWTDARKYCEKVLDIDPENAEAYLGKLMADLGVTKKEKLGELDVSFSDNPNYKRAVRYATRELSEELSSYANIAARREAYKNASNEDPFAGLKNSFGEAFNSIKTSIKSSSKNKLTDEEAIAQLGDVDINDKKQLKALAKKMLKHKILLICGICLITSWGILLLIIRGFSISSTVKKVQRTKDLSIIAHEIKNYKPKEK